MFKHILVPTDGSDLSHKAIAGGIELAQVLGARVTAYSCLPQYPYSPFSDFAAEAPAEFQARCEREADAHLREVEQAAR
jgi:nucleotide-binding universal stress UspA family protein